VLQAAIRQFAEDRDWRKFHDPKNLAMAIAVEAGELMEHFRWLRNEQSWDALKDAKTREEIEQEFADVMILLLEFASEATIDVRAAVERKMMINAARYPVEKSRGSCVKHDRLLGNRLSEG
jgi:NTP pyrophosphatase (non-canonical NTP hydrolase)